MAPLSVSRTLLSHRHPLARQIYKVFAKLRVILAKVCQPYALVGELDAVLRGCHRTITAASRTRPPRSARPSLERGGPRMT